MAQNQIRPWLMSHDEFTALRKSTGLSQAVVAKTLGMSPSTIGLYERGLRAAPKHVITMLQILAAKRKALITGHRQAILEAVEAPFRISF